MRNFIKVSCIVGGISIAALGQAAHADFYVSPSGSDSNPGTLAAPFATVDKARQAGRGVNAGMSSDITVYLRGGTYFLNNTLAFDPGDSGFNGHSVIYRNYSGETPVLSGGRGLTGWTNIGGGVWRASSQGLRFRQIYINGVRGIRARTPNVGSYYHLLNWIGPQAPWPYSADGATRYIDVNSGEISSWNQLNKVEMVISKEWIQANLRIASFSASGGVAHVHFQNPDEWKGYAPSCSLREPNDQGCGYQTNDAYFFENAREFLDSPGEWYLDESAGTVDYMPRSGEDMTSAVVMVPVLDRLVGIIGGAGNPVHDLQFYGITFEHSNWMQPSDEGLTAAQGDSQYLALSNPVAVLPGAVHVEYADTVRFERNVIQYTGAAGLELYQGSRNITVVGNVIRETGAGGIDVALRINNSDSNAVVHGITIQNNFINGIGRDYRSGQGIQTNFVDSILIDHNEVTDVSYSGIGTDWRGTDGGGSLSLQVTNNRVYNVVNMMADGGGVYLFEVTRPGAQVVGNYVSDIHPSAFAGPYTLFGIYLDNATSGVTVKNNVVQNVESGLFLQHYVAGAPALNNTIVNFQSDINWDPAINTGTTITSDGTYNESAIISNAGIQQAFQDIKSGGGTPPPLPSNIAPSAPQGVIIH